MATVAVMGAGSWGTAFATICADAGSSVRLWARRPEVAASVNAERRNPDYLPGITLNAELWASPDPVEVLAGADIVAVAVPSHALADSLRAWAALVPADAIAVSLVKGIALETRKTACDLIADLWPQPDSHVVAVSGPNLAKECAAGRPSGSVAACPDLTVAEQVQAACHTTSFRVYTNPDRVGVEVGGAVKNAIAIAAGIARGLGYGDNMMAMLVTRGLAEMTRFGLAVGGQAMTFSGLAGMGDLVATCMSPQSRNRHVGEQIGRGQSLAQVTAAMNGVAEGVTSSRAILDIAHERQVDMPIVAGVVAVLHGGTSPRAMAEALMGRSPKAEFHGFDDTQ